MAEPRSRRRRLGWTIGTVALVVVLVGAGAAYGAMHAGQSSADYRTAEVSTGNVEQSVALSGTVQRVDQVTATFPASGTVSAVAVGVGQTVVAGQPLATMDPAALTASLLSAQASLAQAEAALATDESPSSTTASGASAASAAASGSPSTSTRGSAAGGAGGSGGSTDALAAADAALAAVNRALDAENSVCAPVFGGGDQGSGAPSRSGSTPTPTPTPTSTPTPTPTSTPTPTPTPSSSATDAPDSSSASTPTPAETPSPEATPTPTPTPTPTETPTPQPSPTVDPGSTGTGDTSAAPTAAEIEACAGALQKTADALQRVRGAIQSIVAGLAQTSTSASHTASSASTTSSAARSAGGASGGSTASRIAADNVTILQDQNAVAQAQSDLDAATLVAPIAGVVGEIDLVPGQVAATSSGIVIVGDGAAAVTVDVPLADVPVLHAGQAAEVTPLGAVDAVPGVIQAVNLLPSSSSGSSPTYPATVLVADPTAALASGSSATVEIAVGSAKGVLRIPASAMSGRTGDSAMVMTVSGGTATPTAVTLGVVGGGWAQVMSGLDAGEKVVLADASQPLPTNTTGLGGGGFFRRQGAPTGATQSGAGPAGG